MRLEEALAANLLADVGEGRRDAEEGVIWSVERAGFSVLELISLDDEVAAGEDDSTITFLVDFGDAVSSKLRVETTGMELDNGAADV